MFNDIHGLVLCSTNPDSLHTKSPDYPNLDEGHSEKCYYQDKINECA